MAARKNRKCDDKTREKIKTTQLLKRLTDYALGNNDPQSKKPIEMSSQQVSAGLGILRKSLPDLSATELSSDPESPLIPPNMIFRPLERQDS